MPNPYNPNPYNEDQDRARQQPLYDQPGGLRQDASQEYHKGDGVFQIPWWVIVITFCFAAWPIGVAMMIINHLLRMGKISAPQSWSQNNRQTGRTPSAPSMRTRRKRKRCAGMPSAWCRERKKPRTKLRSGSRSTRTRTAHRRMTRSRPPARMGAAARIKVRAGALP